MANTLLGEWQFINTTSAPPSTGQVRLNNATQTSATRVWVHKTAATNDDASALLSTLKLGGEINLQNKGDATKSQNYRVTGTPIDQGTYVEYPVAWLTGDQPVVEQRANLTSVSVPVTVAVKSPGMVASVGNVTLKFSSKVPVEAPAMLMQTDTVKVVGHIHLPDQAFPSDTPAGFSPGMTLRQWYAGQAAAGFIAFQGPSANLVGRLADLAFRVADSMLEFEVKEAAGFTRQPQPDPLPIAQPPQSAPATVTPKEVEALQAKEEAA